MVLATVLSVAGAAQSLPAAAPYPWLESHDAGQDLEKRIAPPAGFERVEAAAGSFAAWLRGLPLKPGRPQVLLHDGRPKRRQDAHWAVVDMDVGRRDLQQCADAAMRLRAEYLYSRRDYPAIHFNQSDGRPLYFLARGPDTSYRSFRKYLDHVFTYAGSYSLEREMRRARPREMRIGDVFIQGGFPGHAVMVLDMAAEPGLGRRIFLLAQSYMPAQEVHILKNLKDPGLDPWYALESQGRLETPEWEFRWEDLRRFGP